MHASNGKLRRSPCDGGEVPRPYCFRHHRDFALSQIDLREALVLALRRPAQVVGVRRFRRRGDLKRADVLHPPQIRLPVADDQVTAQPSNCPDMRAFSNSHLSPPVCDPGFVTIFFCRDVLLLISGARRSRGGRSLNSVSLGRLLLRRTYDFEGNSLTSLYLS